MSVERFSRGALAAIAGATGGLAIAVAVSSLPRYFVRPGVDNSGLGGTALAMFFITAPLFSTAGAIEGVFLWRKLGGA